MEQKDTLKVFLYKQAGARNHLLQYEVPPKQSKKLLPWYLITQDIDVMISCINAAVKLGKVDKDNLLLITALWEKMLITYGKIFLGSADGFTTLNSKWVDKADLILHDELLLIRNSYLAHRGVNSYEHSILIASVVGTESNCRIEFLVPGIKLLGHYGSPVKVRQYLNRLKKKIEHRLAHIKEKVEQEIYADLGLEPILE